MGNKFSLRVSSKACSPVNTLILVQWGLRWFSDPQSYKKVNLCCVKHLVCGNLLYQLLAEVKCTTWKLLCKFYLETFLRTIALETVFQVSLRNCCKEVRKKRGYTGFFFSGKKWSWTSKDYSWSWKQTLKLMLLVLFYVWEAIRVWVHSNYSLGMHLS